MFGFLSPLCMHTLYIKVYLLVYIYFWLAVSMKFFKLKFGQILISNIFNSLYHISLIWSHFISFFVYITLTYLLWIYMILFFLSFNLCGGGGGLVAKSFISNSWDCMDCSLPGSSIHGVFQARILEWVANSFFRGSS